MCACVIRFDTWALQLHEGFNLLFYGLGSKKRLLEVRDGQWWWWLLSWACFGRRHLSHTQSCSDTTQSFCASASSSACVVVVNGYVPSVSIHEVLSMISSKVGVTLCEVARVDKGLAFVNKGCWYLCWVSPGV